MADYKEVHERLLKRYFGSEYRKNYLIHYLYRTVAFDQYLFFETNLQYKTLLQHRKGMIAKILRLFCIRQYQKSSERLGYDIPIGMLGDDVIIYHRASVVINPDAVIGNGCKFHGDCTIGVLRTGERGCPRIGNNVDIGAGARILGDIEVADNIKIGANSVVMHSFLNPGVSVVGAPGHEVQKQKKD